MKDELVTSVIYRGLMSICQNNRWREVHAPKHFHWSSDGSGIFWLFLRKFNIETHETDERESCARCESFHNAWAKCPPAHLAKPCQCQFNENIQCRSFKCLLVWRKISTKIKNKCKLSPPPHNAVFIETRFWSILWRYCCLASASALSHGLIECTRTRCKCCFLPRDPFPADL